MPNYTSHHTKNSLTRSQVASLELLYRFRFLTTDLAGVLLQRDRSTVYERFSVLVSRGYVLQHYESSYRLRRKAARYSLTTKGIAYLRHHTGLPEVGLRRHYGNQNKPEPFIDEGLERVARYLRLQQQLPHHDIYTRQELSSADWLSPLPELLLKPFTTATGFTYLLDYMPAQVPTWLMRRRLRQHQDTADYFRGSYPEVLLVAGNQSTESRLFAQTESSLQDFRFFITRDELLLDEMIDAPWVDVDLSETDDYQRVSLA